MTVTIDRMAECEGAQHGDRRGPAKDIRIVFENTYTYAEVLDLAPQGEGSSHKEAKDREWDLGVGFDGAIDLARKGWTPGLAEMSKLTEAIRLPDVDLSRLIARYNVTGGSVNVGRFLGGDPRHMRQVHMTNAKPIVKIAVGAAHQCRFSATDILYTGAAVAAVADLLMATGFGVQIDTACIVGHNATGGNGRGFGHRIITTLKSSDEVTDMSTIAFGIAHPAYLRRILFGVMEMQPQPVRRLFGYRPDGYGYGYPCYDAPSRLADAGYDLDFTGWTCTSLDAAVNQAVAQVEAWRERCENGA